MTRRLLGLFMLALKMGIVPIDVSETGLQERLDEQPVSLN